MRHHAPVRRAMAAAAGAALLLTGTVAFTPAASAHTVSAAPSAAPLSAGDGTPAGAVAWYQAHIGSTAYQNWNGASPKHTTGTPPAGSFVYWNISAYGHVGISDGKGGAYASSVQGAIGHITSLSYFANYRGWTPGAVPHA
jgi:hypothetical protein